LKRLFPNNCDIYVVSFLQSSLGELEQKIINIQHNSGFHTVFFIFHQLKCNLLIVSGNMDAIIKIKKTIFQQLDYADFSAISNCFRWAWIEDNHNTTLLFIVSPRFSTEWKVSCTIIFLTIECFPTNLNTESPFLHSVLSELDWKFIERKQNSAF